MYLHQFTHTLYSAVYNRLVGTYESQIRCGRTVFDMPGHHIAPLYTSVVACCTGPGGGICQLELDKDAPTGTHSLFMYIRTCSSLYYIPEVQFTLFSFE